MDCGPFLRAPVPSGWTLMLVESSETASMRMRHHLFAL